MTDSFPRQAARTRNFTLGAPRSFSISPDGGTVVFLRSRSGVDPVNCLWALDVASGAERLVCNPADLLAAGAADDPVEKARRERVRERAGGIVAYATDQPVRLAAFTLAGVVYVADLGSGAVRSLATATPAADPRPAPDGTSVAYVSNGVLRLFVLATGEDRILADPAGEAGVTFGLADFIAAEELGRTRGYWWAPDNSALLVARVDENPVPVWHIADPANPAATPAQVRYPAAGTANAVVTLHVVTTEGKLTAVDTDHLTFPYLINAHWPGNGGSPLTVVLSRDQRHLRLLAVDVASGATTVIRTDTDPSWVDVVAGVPATLADGRIVWTADSGAQKRLLAGSPATADPATADPTTGDPTTGDPTTVDPTTVDPTTGDPTTGDPEAGGAFEPLTPDGLQVRQVLSVDDDTILFTASAEDPATISVWTAGPDGVRMVSPADGLHGGALAAGTLVLTSRDLTASGQRVRVLRLGAADGAAAEIGSHAEWPSLPAPRPRLTYSGGPRRLRTAILLPSWHQPGSGKLPVLCDPYGGPHAQRVLQAYDAYLVPQWFAEQGFAVVVADGRGTPGRGPEWEREITGDLATPVLEDQVEALHSAAAECTDLDLSKVAIRGWSFGGYLSALAVLRRPDVFHAGIAGAPVTDWRLYDTGYTERYLGHPDFSPENYERSSLLADAPSLSRPLMIIHGLADDNVVVAHSLRLSSALLAAGRPHTVLPLTGVTHMAAQEEVAENLLLLQVDFLRSALDIQSGSGNASGS